MHLRPIVLALRSLLALVPARAAEPPAPAVSRSNPNIIVIFADDLGYGDLGCYGSKTISTPRLDRMAKEGARFTDFYVAAPFCSPSRAALLTGRLPARCGVPYVLFPTEHTGLPPSEVTLAELLKPAGYATACVGKWHLGWHRELRPLQQGFDEYFGLLHTNDVEEWTPGTEFRQLSLFEPLQLRDGDRVVESPADQTTLTERYTRRATDFIRKNRERPFFLYLAHTMPHIPQYASPAFAGKSKDGVYGDAIEELDWSTGQILDELRQLGLAERTLVIFTSDNGANMRAARANPNARFPGHSFGGSNAPLRDGKGRTFEGGVRVPCIAWWPGTVAAGRNDPTPTSTLDFFPTFARLAKATLPVGVVLDGADISRVIRGLPGEMEPRLLYYYFGVQLQAVREGNWKLIVPIAQLPSRRVPSLWFDHQPGLFERQHRLWPKAALYDLAKDIGEQNDVADTHPDVVARLHEKARQFDLGFQPKIADVLYLPGPRAPAPGQIRQARDDIREWAALAK
ncbi:MAG: Arylsulfatase [Verrucomicrobiota bacterium]|jgi:arylsulfatase A-like enzyme